MPTVERRGRSRPPHPRPVPFVHPRREAHAHEQPLGAHEARRRLPPRLLMRADEDLVPARPQFLDRLGHGRRRGSTSNSIHAWGTGRSTGHSVVPKVAWAAWVSGQIANALTPGSCSVWKYPPSSLNGIPNAPPQNSADEASAAADGPEAGHECDVHAPSERPRPHPQRLRLGADRADPTGQPDRPPAAARRTAPPAPRGTRAPRADPRPGRSRPRGSHMSAITRFSTVSASSGHTQRVGTVGHDVAPVPAEVLDELGLRQRRPRRAPRTLRSRQRSARLDAGARRLVGHRIAARSAPASGTRR